MAAELFDPLSGRLELSQRTLQAVADIHKRLVLAGDGLARLEQLGLLSDGVLEPRIARLASVVAQPDALLSVELVRREELLRCQGWIDADAAVLATARGGAQTSNLSLMPRSLLAWHLARLVRLGPRPRPKVVEPVAMDRILLETLLGVEQPLAVSAIESLCQSEPDLVPPWIELLAGLSRRSSRRWSVGCWWNSATQSPEARRLEVIDAEAGLFLLLPEPRRDSGYARVTVRPATASHLWGLLCAVAPDPSEAIGPLA